MAVKSSAWITHAIRFHCWGRSLMIVFIGSFIVLMPESCPIGWWIAGIGTVYLLFTLWTVCGLRMHDGTDNPGWGFHFIPQTRSVYPAWTFVPDVILLTLLVLHTGAIFSSFVSMYLILGTLGDYALISSPKRRLFIPCFILGPYLLVVLLSISQFRSGLTYYVPWISPFFDHRMWAPVGSIASGRFAFMTFILYAAGIYLANRVLRYLRMTSPEIPESSEIIRGAEFANPAPVSLPPLSPDGIEKNPE